ncbi:hypothetical protein BH10ACT2_BH10ACT2_04730 [soil metagenome]
METPRTTTAQMTTTTTSPRRLRARSVAYALLARLLGADPSAITDDVTIDALQVALTTASDPAISRLISLDRSQAVDPAELAGRWVRWFELGRVAPYEGSNVLATAGGITPRLADVAGFYRAFGLAVSGDRPDHIVAQLEFLAVALLTEAEALERGDSECADVASRATRSFVRDHIGGWIDAWSARVAEVDELVAWVPFAAAAADLVRSEAAQRNVIPLRDNVALVADLGVADDLEATLTCEDDDTYSTDDQTMEMPDA